MTSPASEISQAEVEPSETLLLVEDDLGLQKQMRWALAPYRVDVAASREEALSRLARAEAYKIIILDLGLPPDANGASEGLSALDEILGRYPHSKVIVVSGNVDRANAVRAVAQGAFDFIAKPIDIEVLKLIIQRALRMADLEAENSALRADMSGQPSGLIFVSDKMAQVAQMIQRVGPLDVNVLLGGETGTGKDVVARALHQVSPRSEQPFVAINCASIPANLLESELFGHERGAFTGAVKRTVGKFEMADKGTLFLDEIGDMPLELQSKLLRFLQERRLERIGGREFDLCGCAPHLCDKSEIGTPDLRAALSRGSLLSHQRCAHRIAALARTRGRCGSFGAALSGELYARLLQTDCRLHAGRLFGHGRVCLAWKRSRA